MELINACKHNDIVIVKKLLQQPSVNVNCFSDTNPITSPLFIACSNGYLEIAKLLLDDPNINVNITCYGYFTPLHIACKNKHLDIVKLLLNNPNIDVNRQSYTGETPLFSTLLLHGNVNTIAIFALLLNHASIDVNSHNNNGNTVFYVACQNGYVDIIKLLLSHDNFNPNEPECDRVTALHTACQYESYEVVKLLLQTANYPKMNFTARDDYNQTCLAIACRKRNLQIVELLLCSGLYSPGNSIINNVINSGNCCMIVNNKDAVSSYIIQMEKARDQSNVLVLNLLLKYFKINSDDITNNKIVLACACTVNMIETIKMLLMFGGISADEININDRYYNHELIKQYKSNPNIRDTWIAQHVATTFTYVVCYCDDYFRLQSLTGHNMASKQKHQFFQICGKLPMELQMLICNLVFGISKTNIPSIHVNQQINSILV